MRAGLIAINVAAVIFGTAALFGKMDVSPVWIVSMRGLFAAFTLFIFSRWRGGLVPVRQKEQIKNLLFTGVVLAVHWLTFFASVQWAGVAVATLTFAAFPFFTVLMTAGLRRKVPRLLEIMAGFTIVGAVGLLVDLKMESRSLEGLGVGLVSALAFAVFGIKAKGLTRQLPPLTVSFGQNLVVGVLLLPFLLWASPAPTSGMDWGWLVALGVITTALMHQLYLFALTRLSPTICSGFIALEPVYAMAFAALFFGDALTMKVVVSGILILGASFLMLYADQSVGHET